MPGTVAPQWFQAFLFGAPYVTCEPLGPCIFFGYLGFFKLLGRSEFALRRGFAFGKTLERRKSGAAQKGRWARFKIADSKF